MTPNERNAIRELLESRLDALHEALHQSTAELKDGQLRIEKEANKRLDRIEDQTRQHNGRMTKLEEQHIHDETLRLERERVAAEHTVEDQDSRHRWLGVIPAVIAGTSSGLVILVATLLTTGRI
jgi:flagellar hook-length control protein FliK